MRASLVALVALLSTAAAAALAAGSDETRGIDEALEAARAARAAVEVPGLAALGERLFAAPLLSIDHSVSCASCHDPARGFADDEPTSRGVHGRRTLRNAPTLYNRALGKSFMWDGRAATLEEQVLLPIADEREMALPVDAAVARLAADAEWSAAFEEVFGAPPSRDSLARALAAFVRTLTHRETPFDRFRRLGDVGALTATERAGMWLFESRAGCWRCHTEPNFTDERLHATGVGAVDGRAPDGRFAITGDEADRGRFKTPTLRGLVETAPYMHDGSLATLEEVVEFYRGGGRPNASLSPLVRPIEMTDAEAANLVAFLRSLSRRVPAEPEDSQK